MVKSSEYIIAEMEFKITTTEKHKHHKLVLKLCFAYSYMHFICTFVILTEH